MAETADEKLAKVTPPDGMYAAKVDSAGRIKLPVEYQRYLAKLHDPEMFATSTEDTMAKIYINGSWSQTKEKLFAATDQQELTMAYFRVAAKFGGNVELDSNGRVTLPQELRRKMSWQDSPVQLLIFKDLIQIYPAEGMATQVTLDMALLKDNKRSLGALGVL